jgi:phosphoglycolate phosphatase-like HAD superfamily hydrolase
MTPPLLVLDFDGVICDSVDECFVSSWTAYHEVLRGRTPGTPGEKERRAFAALRPYIRAGEDFILIQQLIEDGRSVENQAGFDQEARRCGAALRARSRDAFYQARSAFLARDRAGWIALNRIYPHVRQGFRMIPPGAPVSILSTKKPPFIAEILSAHGLPFDAGKITWSDTEPKLITVERLRAEAGSSSAVFIEDQVDAITGNANPAITVHLATWGYVQQAWLATGGPVPLLTPEGFLRLLESLYRRGA